MPGGGRRRFGDGGCNPTVGGGLAGHHNTTVGAVGGRREMGGIGGE